MEKKVAKCKEKAERNGVVFCGNSKYSCLLRQELGTCPIMMEEKKKK